ncbi:MAG: cytochrome C oxidase subunit IV family protein [Candidatus Hydrogenedentes bacterium]|nr:cytochrome C oxidase subunit IV family protein [Candidatus Hydrogenedentota bacterium]
MSGHHIVMPNTYRQVLIVLMVLMAATIIAAKWEPMNIGITGNLLIALAIAGCKMTCIMLIFMHVKYSSKLVQVFAFCGLFWFAIMMVFTFNDYLTRSWNSPFITPAPVAGGHAAPADHAAPASHATPAPADHSAATAEAAQHS